jgi:5-(carboxyamino)imidazole ribonucleotide synthase
MSIQAAQRLGARCISLDPGKDTPASQVAEAHQGALNDPEAVAQLIRACDKLTLENEFIPAAALKQAFQLADRDPADLLPGIETLALIQDKLLQRQTLAAANIPSPHAVSYESPAQANREIGLPLVLKARFGGYDGRGTKVVRTAEDLELAGQLEGWLAETYVPFARELAIMVVRTPAQSIAMDLVETVQPSQVCDHTLPADWRGPKPTPDVVEIAKRAIEAVHGFGIFGVELFQLETGEVLVNEIAPRPHNTGHYSLDWGAPSQFDYHVRAALGLGLPSVAPSGYPTVMANLLGREDPNFEFLAARRRLLEFEPNARLHWYGKAESRPGRKLGHINIVDQPDSVERALAVREAFFGA